MKTQYFQHPSLFENRFIALAQDRIILLVFSGPQKTISIIPPQTDAYKKLLKDKDQWLSIEKDEFLYMLRSYFNDIKQTINPKNVEK